MTRLPRRCAVNGCHLGCHPDEGSLGRRWDASGRQRPESSHQALGRLLRDARVPRAGGGRVRLRSVPALTKRVHGRIHRWRHKPRILGESFPARFRSTPHSMTAKPRKPRPAAADDLPDFAQPPLAEVVLGIQFDPIVGLSSARLGEVWGLFRDRFPTTEDHPPLAAAFEHLDSPAQPRELQINLDFMRPPLPRCWFTSRAGDEVLQFQQDRFHHNWRRGASEYPRYPVVRERFESEATDLIEYLETAGIGAIEINQCEVSYINHIVADEYWSEPGQGGRVLRLLDSGSAHGLGPQEHVRLEASFLIVDESREPRGRLHASLVSGILRDGSKPMLALTLTARGAPIGSGVEGALKFLDLGRRWTVRSFADLTTERMHKVWGRTR